jgi:tetratricopeptide (TPR) repeat protein
MAKSSTRGGGPIPAAVTQAPLGVSRPSPPIPDWLRRAETAGGLGSVLSKFFAANANLQAPDGLTSTGPKTARKATAQAREAHRSAQNGVRLIHEGRPAEAVPLLRRSVKLNPGVSASHHDLGVALMGAGRLEQAAESFAAALRLDPGLASAHHLRAYALDNLGQEAKAMESYKAAVAMKPDLVLAQLRLGDLYQARRLRVEAATAFRAAAAATAGTVLAQVAEARALDALGAFEEALAAMRAIVETHPDNAEALAFLGKLLGEAGFTAEAAAHHLRVTELLPEMNSAWSGVATNKKFTPEDGPLIARMNAALERAHVTPRDRLALHFALGKAHDDIGDYETAMRNFEAGNRLRASAGGLRRDALAWRIDQLIQATPPGYRDRQPDPGVDDATPILIVGMPRSGSTLTEQILSSHPDVAAGGELEFWASRDTPRQDTFGITATPEATRRLADDYLTMLRAFGPDAKRVSDKALNNFMLLGVIHRIFPNATLIHCRRHPIDNALSIFTTNFGTTFDFVSTRSDIVFFFRQYQRLMAHWREALPPDRFVEVDYEALVADPEPHARRLIAACGLDWNDACLTPHRNTRTINTASLWQARQPIYRTSIQRWRRYEPWLGELRELAPEAWDAAGVVGVNF